MKYTKPVGLLILGLLGSYLMINHEKSLGLARVPMVFFVAVSYFFFFLNLIEIYESSETSNKIKTSIKVVVALLSALALVGFLLNVIVKHI